MEFITQKFIEGAIWCLSNKWHTLFGLFILCVGYYIYLRICGYTDSTDKYTKSID